MFTNTNHFQTVMQSGKHTNPGNFQKHFQLMSLSFESQLYSFTDSFNKVFSQIPGPLALANGGVSALARTLVPASCAW